MIMWMMMMMRSWMLLDMVTDNGMDVVDMGTQASIET